MRESKSEITGVSLAYCRYVGDDCMHSLGNYVKENNKINKIVLDQTNISDIGIKTLSKYLEGNSTLTDLSLNGNKKISDNAIPTFLHMVDTSSVRKLNINWTSTTKNKIVFTRIAVASIRDGLSQIDLKHMFVMVIFNLLYLF